MTTVLAFLESHTVLVAAGVGLVLAILFPRAPYPENVLWAKDVSFASITGSPKRQTISDFIGDKAREGRWWALALDWIARHHFTKTSEDATRSGFYATSFAIFLGGVLIGGSLWALWAEPEFMVRKIVVPFYVALATWFFGQTFREELRK